MEEHKRLQAQIEKREAMLTKVLNGLQVCINDMINDWFSCD
jgi:hypothetical protein